MLQVYFYDFESKNQVSIHKPLLGGIEQILEIFESVSQNSNSHMGIVSKVGATVQLSKYNKFVWLVEIPHQKKRGKYQIFLTPSKVVHLIHDLYNGFNPLKINGLIFEKK